MCKKLKKTRREEEKKKLTWSSTGLELTAEVLDPVSRTGGDRTGADGALRRAGPLAPFRPGTA
jgi:hypothetical protein